MGFDNDCILNIQSLAGEYFCAFCRTLAYPNEALQAPCMHLYCKPCLTYVVSTTQVCPYDQYRVTEADSKPLLESNKALADTIGKIQVHCLYYRTGCTWQGPLSDCTPHCSTCTFGESAVLCNRCGIQLKHRQVQEHALICPGAQSQVQQAGGRQDSASTGAVAASDQTAAVQTGVPASQSLASTPSVASQDANQTAGSVSQPQAAQAATPTPEQWYQQQQQQYQQQYQQYYQQYPGYDPYQQNYQYYYQYPQAAQQYQQQHMQPHLQTYGQPQPQSYGQVQNQPQVQVPSPAQPQLQIPSQGAHQQVQPAVTAQPLLPSTAQAQSQMAAHGQAQTKNLVHGQAQSQTPAQGQTQPPTLSQGQGQPQMPVQGQAQPQTLVQGQAQPQMPAQGQAQPQIPAQGQAPMPAQGQAPPPHTLSYNQVQPYNQSQPAPQQQLQVPPYQQTQPQGQLPHTQPYPLSHSQHYIHPQPQVHSQPHSQTNLQVPVHPFQQQVNMNAQLQTPNPVTGYQSYPQQQLHSQGQGGAAHPVHTAGAQQLAQYPGQVQGHVPSQNAHSNPQAYPSVSNQQLPAMPSAQGQPPSGPSAQQQPGYPHAQQQPGYPHAQQQPGYPLAQQQPGYPHAQQQPGYPHTQQQSGYPHTQQQPGYPHTQQQPGYPHTQQQPGYLHPQQQPGYPFPPRPGVQASPLQHPQNQLLPGQGPPMQPHLSMNGTSQMSHQSHQSHGPLLGTHPDTTQNYSSRPTGPAHKYAQTTGLAGAGQARPLQPNQNCGLKANSQPPFSEQASQSQQGSSGEKSRDPILEKGGHGQDFANKQTKDVGATSGGGNGKDELNLKADNGFVGKADGSSNTSNLSDSRKGPDREGVLAENHAQEGKSKTKGGADERSEPVATDAGVSGVKDPSDASRKANLQDMKHASKDAAAASTGTSSVPQSHSISQINGANSISSIDKGRIVQQPVPISDGVHRTSAPSMPQSMIPLQQPALPGHPPIHLRPQGPGQALPSAAPHEKQFGALHGPGSSAPFGGSGQRPSAPHAGMNHLDDHHIPFPSGIEKFAAESSGFFDGRQPESHPQGPLGRAPFGPDSHVVQPRAMKFRDPSAYGSMSGPGIQDDRAKPMAFEDDSSKFPRPLHLEFGSSSNYESSFPSGPLNHGPRKFSANGMSRSFDKGPHGFDRDPAFKMDFGVGSAPARLVPPGERAGVFPDNDTGRANFTRHSDFAGPGFGRQHMDGFPPRSPGRDYPGFPSRGFGAYADVGDDKSQLFEGSKPFKFATDPFGKPIRDSRFPVPLRDDFDVPGNLRMSEHLGGLRNQDMLPSHMRRGDHLGFRSLHLGETSLGLRGDHLRVGEPPLRGNLAPLVPFGGEKPGIPLAGEPGFRNGFGIPHHAHDAGFHLMEMEPLRSRNPGSVMCRICSVECGSFEGLDLHSQSREHQRKARDMVLSIKQHNKKQKFSKDQASTEEGRGGGRSKNSSFQGRGNKR